MSLRNRLLRAQRGNALPDIYKSLPGQIAKTIQKITQDLCVARSYYDGIPDTRKEWDRLRQNNEFKNQALPEYIFSFDAFVLEFGTCTKDKTHLRKAKREFTTWTKYTTIWSKRK